MKKFYKKFLLLIAIASTCVVMPINSFAVANMTKEEYEQRISEATPVYLESFEEYQNIMTEFDDNEVNKGYYLEQLKRDKDNMQIYNNMDLYEARVIEISESDLRFIQDTSTAEYAMGWYQNGKIVITEEDSLLNGKEFLYMTTLTYDVFGNIKLPDVKVGDTVLISILQTDENTYVAVSPELDTYVERFPAMLTIIIVVLAGLLIYFGKDFPAFVVPAILIVDLVIFYMAPALISGTSVWFALFFVILLNSIAVSVLKNGANWKAFASVFTTLIVTVAMVLVHYAFDSMLNFSGLTLDSFLFSNGIIPDVIDGEICPMFDFHSFSIATTMVIMSVLVCTASSKIVASYEENKAKSKAEELVRNDARSYVSEISIIATVLMVAQMLPKSVTLYAKGYSTKYLLQSEMFLVEILRIIIALIGLALTVPMTVLVCKFLDDK